MEKLTANEWIDTNIGFNVLNDRIHTYRHTIPPLERDDGMKELYMADIVAGSAGQYLYAHLALSAGLVEEIDEFDIDDHYTVDNFYSEVAEELTKRFAAMKMLPDENFSITIGSLETDGSYGIFYVWE